MLLLQLKSPRKPTSLAESVLKILSGRQAICPKNARDARDAWKVPI